MNTISKKDQTNQRIGNCWIFISGIDRGGFTLKVKQIILMADSDRLFNRIKSAKQLTGIAGPVQTTKTGIYQAAKVHRPANGAILTAKGQQCYGS